MPRDSTRFWWRMMSADLGMPLVAAVMVFAAVTGLGIHRASNEVMSPFDEGYHLSYVEYAGHGHIPRVGDPMSRWAEDAYACHLVAPYGDVTIAECGVDGPSELYPESGTNTAASWPPLYYIAAGAWTRVMVEWFGADPLYAARIASVLFWALGAALLAGMAAWKSRNLWIGASIGAMCGLAPVTYSIASYVTPHSAALMIGTGTLAVTLWAMRPSTRLAVRVVAVGAWAALAVMVIPHSLAVLLVAAFSFAAWSLIAKSARLPLCVLGATMLLSGTLMSVLWALVVNARALPTQVAEQPSTPQESLVQAFLEWWDLFLPPGGTADSFHNPAEAAFIVVLGYLISGAIGYVILSRMISHERALAVGLVFAVPWAGVAAGFVLSFNVPARYGATLIPIYWWMLNRRDPERWYSGVLGFLAVCSGGLMLFTNYLTV